MITAEEKEIILDYVEQLTDSEKIQENQEEYIEYYDNVCDEITNSEYYYFTSEITIDEFMKIRRHHWAIENSLHWVLDNSFREDRMRMKKGHASENMNLIRKFVLNVLTLTNCTTESVSASRDNLKYDTPQQLLYKIIRSIV